LAPTAARVPGSVIATMLARATRVDRFMIILLRQL
jgi:hypothetical protein